MLKELDPLVSQYARSRDVLSKALAGLNAAQLEECLPGREWSIKDTLIHIAANEKLMTKLLHDIAEGTTTALPADFDNQKFNDETVAAGRAKSIEQLRADLDESYKGIIGELETITPETIHRRGMHPAAGDADVKEFCLAMYAHHEMHCRDVVEQVRKLKKA
jgi:hypothetical protein